MEIRENSQKRVLLSVLGVAILVVAVIGISFAAYQGTGNASQNTITTGTLMVGYSEDDSAINITNALPMRDADAKDTKNLATPAESFVFTVSSKATGNITVPYTITLTPDNTGVDKVLPDSEVKVWLTKGTDNPETIVDAKTISQLDNSTTRSGSKVLAQESMIATSTVNTVTYTLKMWVADTFNPTGNEGSSYAAKINVDSVVAHTNVN